MDDIYESIKDYNKKRKIKVLIVLRELFIRCKKLNINRCFLTQSYFSVPKDVKLNCTHYIIFELNNKRELQNIAINHSADIEYKEFVKNYRDCTKERYNFLTFDTTQPADKRLKKNFNDP